MKKGTVIILALIVTMLHLFRYNLPESINTVYVFEQINLAAWAIAFIILFRSEYSLKLKCLYLFNIFGVCNASWNLLRGNPQPGIWPEGILFIATVTICIIYYRITKRKRFRTNRK